MNLRDRRMGVVRISKDLLADMFHFPEGHRVLSVRERQDDWDHEFEILVEGPTLPLLHPDASTTRVQLQVTVTEDHETLVPSRTMTVSFIA